jgi:hypothetical protein
LAQKLIDRDERFDRVVLDKKIESREQYFKLLPELIEQIDAIEKKLMRPGETSGSRGRGLDKRSSSVTGSTRPSSSPFSASSVSS